MSKRLGFLIAVSLLGMASFMATVFGQWGVGFVCAVTMIGVAVAGEDS